jgi:hypothetical protein
MVNRCTDCERGPVGFDGHDRLRRHGTLGTSPAMYKCQNCGLTWAREYQGAGDYGWAAQVEAGDA